MKEEGKSVLVCICTVAGCTTPHFLKESCFRVCCITAVNIIHFWPFGLPSLMQGCRNVCFLFVCFLLKQCWDCRQRENSNFWIFMHFMVRNSFTLHHLPVQNCTEGVKKKKTHKKTNIHSPGSGPEIDATWPGCWVQSEPCGLHHCSALSIISLHICCWPHDHWHYRQVLLNSLKRGRTAPQHNCHNILWRITKDHTWTCITTCC